MSKKLELEDDKCVQLSVSVPKSMKAALEDRVKKCRSNKLRNLSHYMQTILTRELERNPEGEPNFPFEGGLGSDHCILN